jgi:hypothetical protein
MHTVRLISVFIAGLAMVNPLTATDWPKDYVVQENSSSPDGNYGMAVRSRESALDQENNPANPVYLANIAKHQLVGQLEEINYFQGQNHRALRMHWAADSTWGVVEDDNRFGFESIVLVTIDTNGFTHEKIGDQVQKPVDHAIATQSQNSSTTAEVIPYFRAQADRTLRVRATATTNPKALADVKSYYARFSGTYDVTSKKWTSRGAFSIPATACDRLSTAYVDDFDKDMIVAPDQKSVPGNFAGAVFVSEEQKATDLDRTLNEVYQAVRFILPKEQFASIKQNQIAWLQTRDRAQSAGEKSKLIGSRIHELQNLLWK